MFLIKAMIPKSTVPGRTDHLEEDWGIIVIFRPNPEMKKWRTLVGKDKTNSEDARSKDKKLPLFTKETL